MADTLQAKIISALKSVRTRGGAGDVVADDMIRGLHVENGNVSFSLAVDPAEGPKLESLRQEAERAAASVPGISSATAILTAERKPANADPHGMAKNPILDLPVHHIIAVASGKGGVGKSTVAFNLALALARSGMKTGLLDADIYGPSVPRLAGLEGKKPAQDKDGRIIPLSAHNLKLMSIGFMVDSNAPMIWRGPMVQTAIYQMLRDTAWGEVQNPLDVLVIDLPPGTGDAQLTIAQKIKVAGAVIVSTPQDLALIDARKAVEMFRKTGVEILGIVENMSTYICPSCGHEAHVFGHGGARDEAQKLGVPFLGEIPLNAQIRQDSDAGTGSTSHAGVFDQIAEKIGGALKSGPA